MGKNLSFKKIGKLILSINNLIESYFNKLRSFISNPKKFQFTRDNRVIFVFAGIVFLTLAYFLLPTSYNKDLIQTIMMEWAYRVPNGMPDTKNEIHLNHLKLLLKDMDLY